MDTVTPASTVCPHCGCDVLNVPLGCGRQARLVPDLHLGRFKVAQALNGTPRAVRVTDPGELANLRRHNGTWRIHTCMGSLAETGGL